MTSVWVPNLNLNLRQLKCEALISYLIFTHSVFHYNLRVLILSLILSGCLSELPETFTLGIKKKLRKIQTEKLKMIVRIVIIKTC